MIGPSLSAPFYKMQAYLAMKQPLGLQKMHQTPKKNYVPAVMGEHTNLVHFFMAILRNAYANTPVLVNFSATFATISEFSVRLVYASRYNYQCLPTAFLIHDGASLNAFENILKNYNFAEYVQTTIGVLSDLYSGGIFPLALSMNFTKVKNHIWGNDALTLRPRHRGLSSACCKPNASSTTNASNMSNICLFKCISTHFFVNGQNCLEKHGKIKQRSNIATALKIKALFRKWLKAHH